MIEVLLLACLLLLVYTHVGYAAVIGFWAALRSRPPRLRDGEPTVTVIIAAHNEAPRIAARLENLLALDYPHDHLEILLGSDGSTDGTQERARAYETRGVTVVAFEIRRGKAAVLNDLVPKAHGEILVFADARQDFEAGALRALVAPLADPEVGAVSGELVLRAGLGGRAGVGTGLGFYWRYEKFIRKSESRVDSTVGVTGAIYAIRRQLYEPIPESTILDDVLIPMRIVRKGYRVVFEPAARAFDWVAADAHHEFVRKVRTIAGNFQLLRREPWLLNPAGNRLWLQTVSHKALRLLSPLFLVGALGLNLTLVAQPLFPWILAKQCAFYAAAFGGYVLRTARRRPRVLGVAYVFCLLHWATVVAFIRIVRGRERVTWETGTLRSDVPETSAMSRAEPRETASGPVSVVVPVDARPGAGA